jgi:hypothetical protein
MVATEACPGHLLHGGQVDPQVEEVPDPGPAQVVGGGSRDRASRPRWRQIRQAKGGELTVLTLEAPGLEHRAKEWARLAAANLDPVFQSGVG